MSVQALKQTSVILMLFVTTLSDPTSVAVLLDIRAMVETAQVIHISVIFFICRDGFVTTLTF